MDEIAQFDAINYEMGPFLANKKMEEVSPHNHPKYKEKTISEI